MKIENYKDGDEVHILPLFNQVFGRPMSNEHWNWRFKDNPAGQTLIKLMWDHGTLVGQYAVSPIKVIVNGESVLTAHSLSTMTHPDYTGRGIFKKLSTSLYNYLENDLGSQAVWGYPNTNSHYGFINSLGWKDMGVLHTMSIDTSLVKEIHGDIRFDIIPELGLVDCEFIKTSLEMQNVYVERSLEYMNWRFVKKPGNNYRILRLFIDDDYIGLAITKIYGSKENKDLELNILEFFVNENVNLGEVISVLLHSTKEKLKRISIWRNINDPLHIQLERVGFTPNKPITYFAARPHAKLPSEFLSLNSWYISMGDSDVF